MDRQDIDALLIGALYGELTPADEARLAAHLDSHPADKTALDDLKSARDKVKASRIFELQTEPPQAISAVLLQEAARRAPRKVAAETGERESWFQRFVRSFAAHPAMAAAAMLVLVVGVATTLYMRNGSVGVEKTVDQSEDTVAANAPVTTPAAPAAEPMAKDQGAAGSAAAYQVGLAEGQLDRKQEIAQAETEKAPAANERAKVAQAVTTAPATTAKTDDAFAYEQKPAAHAAAGKKDEKAKKGTGYLEVETPQAMPKEMPDIADADKDGEAANGLAAGGGGAAKQAGPSNKFATAPGGAPSTGAAGSTQQASPPPPPPPQVAAAPTTPPADYAKNTNASKAAPAKPVAPAKTVAKSPAPAPKTDDAPVEATRGDTDLIAWAKQQHAAAVAKVKAGDCSTAAQLAVGVRSRAYGYYQQNMANDRDLKGCASYIADAVNREEERTSKPKAAKRAADEAPAATSK